MVETIVGQFRLGQRLDAWQLVGGECVLVGIVILHYEKPSIPAWLQRIDFSRWGFSFSKTQLS
jgi:hypothetical protein